MKILSFLNQPNGNYISRNPKDPSVIDGQCGKYHAESFAVYGGDAIVE